MDLTTLKKANDLNQKVIEFGEALNCFEWTYPENEHPPVSTNPQLIIEFDGCDGREEIKLPMALNEVLISFLKAEIQKGLDQAVKEFNDLK